MDDSFNAQVVIWHSRRNSMVATRDRATRPFQSPKDEGGRQSGAGKLITKVGSLEGNEAEEWEFYGGPCIDDDRIRCTFWDIIQEALSLSTCFGPAIALFRRLLVIITSSI